MNYLAYAVSDQNALYLLLQLGVAITFTVSAFRARRHSSARLLELITAVVFGLLLEEGDIIIFGTYSYNRHWLSLGYVPVAIALTWAMIIASAMNFSDALGLSSADDPLRSIPAHFAGLRRLRPFASIWPAPVADALWAIILDLSLDAVAIRIGLWQWNIRLDQGWFGVPWGNFYSWLFVAAMFSFFTRLVRRRTMEHGSRSSLWQLAVPFIGYIGLLLAIVPFTLLQLTVFASNKQATWPIFLVTLVGFIVITAYAFLDKGRRAREAPDRWLMAVRGLMHATFLFALLGTGIILQLPVLLLAALAMAALELLITRIMNASRRALSRGGGPFVVAGESGAE